METKEEKLEKKIAELSIVLSKDNWRNYIGGKDDNSLKMELDKIKTYKTFSLFISILSGLIIIVSFIIAELNYLNMPKGIIALNLFLSCLGSLTLYYRSVIRCERIMSVMFLKELKEM